MTALDSNVNSVDEQTNKHNFFYSNISKKLKGEVENLKDKDGDIIEFGVYCLWDKEEWIRILGDDYGHLFTPSSIQQNIKVTIVRRGRACLQSLWKTIRATRNGPSDSSVNVIGTFGFGKSYMQWSADGIPRKYIKKNHIEISRRY
ncbi:hypothetical protein ROZALSC1DRAFT_25297 [Rozella allomycis CSF55]|uniref:Uncharacterized protein n=1 Tax=Rozella allomycis (strain CSF55) TaxID=988480 RepID=A0A4P9YDY7_ROZAC|nr:hypothetical protein ROZALSC1DRAFT_25297 [Rozella allomycis CSF55]